MSGIGWTRIGVDLPDHVKVMNVADSLGMEETTVIGMLVCIWTWSTASCADGKLRASKPARVIERIARWKGKPGQLYAALVSHRLIDVDPDGIASIHDWMHHNGTALARADRQAEDKRRLRERQELDKCANAAPAPGSRPARATLSNVTDGRTDGRTTKAKEENRTKEEKAAPKKKNGTDNSVTDADADVKRIADELRELWRECLGPGWILQGGEQRLRLVKAAWGRHPDREFWKQVFIAVDGIAPRPSVTSALKDPERFLRVAEPAAVGGTA